MKKKTKSPILLQSAEVSEVVGIPPIYLNKLIERGKYRIVPSIRSSRGRGSRRLFSEDDVYGIALVWWLFEAGLRTDAIQRALQQMFRCPVEEETVGAKEAAYALMNHQEETVVIIREPRTSSKARDIKQKVLLSEWAGAGYLVSEYAPASVLFIPIKDRFEKLKAAMEKFSPSVGTGD